MLYGRQTECALLDSLVEGAVESRSGVLVLRGAPGVGKSALLAYAAGGEGPSVRLHAVGVESEVQLPYAVLHQLLYPVLDRLDALPAPQAMALRGAFGLGVPPQPNRLLVAVAVLTLLSEIAVDNGLVCLVDDAHWLDQPSADALVFAARRMDAEGIVLIFAARDGESHRFDVGGLPELEIQGLAPPDSVALLAERAPLLPLSVARDLATRTGGNPLALRELPAVFTPEELAGQQWVPEPLPVGREVERAFAAAAWRLAEGTRDLLLVAAAEETGDLAVILPAAERLGQPDGALDDAERAGLVTVHGQRLEFRHPLVRSAIYHHATFAARKAAHEALAAVLQRLDQGDRRAWHLATAAVGPDAGLAALLEASADRARRRAGPAAAAAALERSAVLTVDESLRGSRLLSAAEAAWSAGAPERAVALLDRAEPLISGDRLRSSWLQLRGLMELRCGVPETAYELLLRSAALTQRDDPHAALEALVLAGEAASFGGEPGPTIELGRIAGTVGPSDAAEDQEMTSLLVGMAQAMSGDWDRGARRLRAVVEASLATQDPVGLLRGGRAALYVGDDRAAHALHARAVETIRRTGAVAMLPVALDRLALSHLLEGRLADAAMAGEEGLHLARDIGQEESPAHHLIGLALVAAWRGDEEACHRLTDEAAALAATRRLGLVASVNSWALGLLELGLGRPQEALTHLVPMVGGQGRAHAAIRLWATPDLVEAAARAGRPELAIDALKLFEGWARRVDQPSARAVAGRCRALLTPGQDGVSRYAAALDLHLGASRPLERARTELVYGEALRRARRPAESRTPLRASLDTFERLGATPWAQRARSELRATGEVVPAREPTKWDLLTPQELQIARLAADGQSNPDIAGRLFLSRRTVEYHLHKVFTKLGLASRRELVHANLS